MIITIIFEDHGQDFLEWDIDTKRKKVIGCRPFQSSIWVGANVYRKYLAHIKPGEYINVCRGPITWSNPVITLKYPIKRVIKKEDKNG